MPVAARTISIYATPIIHSREAIRTTIAVSVSGKNFRSPGAAASTDSHQQGFI